MKRFFYNTSLSLLGKVIGMIFLFLLDIFLARTLDVDQYAEWAYFFAIATILFFIGWLGINMSAKVNAAKCADIDDLQLCINSAFVLRLICSLVIAPMLSIIMVVMSPKLGYPIRYPELRNLFIAGGGLIFFNTFTEFYKQLFMGLENFLYLFLITVFEYAGYLLFSILFLLTGNRVIYVAYAYICAGVLIFALGIIIIKKKYGALHFPAQRNKCSKKTAIDILRYAMPLFLVGIGTAVLTEIDTFMLGILGSKSDVAIYNIAKGLNSKAAHINYSIAVGGMTSFAVISRGKIEMEAHKFYRISRINILVTAAISAAMFIIAPLLIKVFYGEKYIMAGNALRFLIPYYVLYSLSTFYSTFLDFRGIAKARSIAYISVVVLDIILNYFLIPNYGAAGAAFATSISLMPYTIFVIIRSASEWKTIKTVGGDKDE